MIGEDTHLKDALVAMSEQAEYEALHHSNRYSQLTASHGPVETLQARVQTIGRRNNESFLQIPA